MAWEHALILGLTVGFVIGALVIRLGNSKIRNHKLIEDELEKNKAELDKYRKELTGHFAQSAELLNNMARDYRQLYQHMVHSSTTLLSDAENENPFDLISLKIEKDNDEPTLLSEDIQGIQIQDDPQESLDSQKPPKDYSGKASGLLESNTTKSEEAVDTASSVDNDKEPPKDYSGKASGLLEPNSTKIDEIEKSPSPTDKQQPPKDYSGKASGLLEPERKES